MCKITPKKRIMAILLACVMLFAIPMSASAQTVAETTTAAAAAETIQPRSFTRDCDVSSLGTSYKYVTDDDNWYSEPFATITFLSSDGPTEVRIDVRDKNGNSYGTYDLTTGDSVRYSLDAGNFAVYVKKLSGNTQDVTIRVKLHW